MIDSFGYDDMNTCNNSTYDDLSYTDNGFNYNNCSFKYNSKKEEKPKEDEYTKEQINQFLEEVIPGGNKFGKIFADITPKGDKEHLESPAPNNISIDTDHIVTFDFGSTDPAASGRRLYRKKSAYFFPNAITPLVGCNGSGKSTMITCIRSILREYCCPFVLYDNLINGGSNAREECGFSNLGLLSTLVTSSEGECIMINSYPKLEIVKDVILGKYKRDEHCALFKDNDHIFLLIDALDSGFSIDNIANIKAEFNALIKLSKEHNKYLYIIVAANSFEVARDCDCWDVQGSKLIGFGKDYEEYRRFIIDSRIRILKQWKAADEKKLEEED